MKSSMTVAVDRMELTSAALCSNLLPCSSTTFIWKFSKMSATSVVNGDMSLENIQHTTDTSYFPCQKCQL